MHPLTIQSCLLSFLALVHNPTYRFLCVLIQWSSQDPIGITHLMTTSIPFLFFIRLQILGFITVFFKQNLFCCSSPPPLLVLLPTPYFPDFMLLVSSSPPISSAPLSPHSCYLSGFTPSAHFHSFLLISEILRLFIYTEIKKSKRLAGDLIGKVLVTQV